MKITYISHSGFLVEHEDCTWLFDYYEGEIPPVRADKPLFIFVSHWHQDHFNPEIFSISGASEIHYVISNDTKKHMKKYMPQNNLHFMKPGESLVIPVSDSGKSLSVQTLKSTDCGVAFLIRYDEKNIYHAGDLNWWIWQGESKQYNNNMTANFLKYTAPLKDMDLFAAFLPLDPRQEDWYDKGILHILENSHVKYAFPMHFWKDFSVISKFAASPQGKKYKEHIVQIEKEGQSFLCTEKIKYSP